MEKKKGKIIFEDTLPYLVFNEVKYRIRYQKENPFLNSTLRSYRSKDVTVSGCFERNDVFRISDIEETQLDNELEIE